MGQGKEQKGEERMLNEKELQEVSGGYEVISEINEITVSCPDTLEKLYENGMTPGPITVASGNNSIIQTRPGRPGEPHKYFVK